MNSVMKEDTVLTSLKAVMYAKSNDDSSKYFNNSFVERGDKIMLTSDRYAHYQLFSGTVGTVEANCIPLFGAILASFKFATGDDRYYEISQNDFKVI